MPALAAGIHVFLSGSAQKDVDDQDKPKDKLRHEGVAKKFKMAG